MSNAAAYDALVQVGEARRLDLELGKSGQRVEWIDGARGLSITAMIVSHVGLVSGLTPTWFHLYVMRPFAPVFLLLLGMLWRPGLRRRHLQFGLGLIVAQGLAFYIGFAVPNILVVMGLCLLLMPFAVRFPHLTVAACVTQLTFWPLPEWWTGYAIGFALPLVLVGALLPADGFLRLFGNAGARLGLAPVGRRPLTFYLGHLIVLAGIVYWFSGR